MAHKQSRVFRDFFCALHQRVLPARLGFAGFFRAEKINATKKSNSVGRENLPTEFVKFQTA